MVVVNYGGCMMTKWTYEGGGCIGLVGSAGADFITGGVGRRSGEEEEEK